MSVSDDGISPDRIAQVMGQPDRCQHAVHLINDLVHTAQVRLEHRLSLMIMMQDCVMESDSRNEQKREFSNSTPRVLLFPNICTIVNVILIYTTVQIILGYILDTVCVPGVQNQS